MDKRTTFTELSAYTKLAWELAWRDLKLQYRKPVLGFFWMLIIPFSLALVYKLLFSDILRIQSGRYPFFIYLLTAIVPWNFFAGSVQRATRCMLDNRNILTQITFPKALIPASIVLSSLVNFLAGMAVVLVFIRLFNVALPPQAVFLPAVIAAHALFTLGIVFFISALHVFYRDVEYVLQVMLTALFFLTPAVYQVGVILSLGLDPGVIRLYFLNPFSGIINLYRLTLLGGYAAELPAQAGPVETLIVPVTASFAVCVLGLAYFMKSEKRFHDHLNV